MSLSSRPLSEQFRPKRFEEFVGQERWLKDSGLILHSIHEKRPINFLVWGPPGTGKTSLASLYLNAFDLPHVSIHPSRFQLSQMKEVLDRAEAQPLFRPTLVWIDEIHRLTRPQQDILLQGMEEGSICLIAATTENPSFVLSNALLSRLHVITFEALAEKDLKKIVEQVLKKFPSITFSQETSSFLLSQAQGDARKLLSFLDILISTKNHHKHYEKVEDLSCVLSIHSGSLVASGEGRYLLVSALHKSVRGSDVNASLYWLSRMLQSGEDRLYIARRLIRMALEDIGLADPEALQITLRAQESYKALGSPEGEIALFQAVIYLALSPKSASTYTAMKSAMEHAEKTGHIQPPKHIINAPTHWMKKEGFSEGYVWDHDVEDAFSGQRYFPENIPETAYYFPVERGFEREMDRRLRYFSKLRDSRKESKNPHRDEST